MGQEELVFVIFDGIENSVFDSQVLKLIINNNINNKILLISFEKTINSSLINKINNINNNFSNINIKIFKKLPYTSNFFLLKNIYNLKKILNSKSNKYKIIARGPIAGFISIKAATNSCETITVQARGLLPNEYEYEHANKTKNLFKKILNKFRKNIFYNLEKTVYNKIINNKNNIKIEAVSQALKDYLISEYNAQEQNISVAHLDIPKIFDSKTVNLWKLETKNLLKIPQDYTVYCYNGSAKSWQCPEETIKFFAEQTINNPKCYLLVLTQEPEIFYNLLKKSEINSQNYFIKFVEHDQIYKYLSAADYGLIFREKNILNWISRPTKVLEYESVGLKIIHNNTVKWLIDKDL